MAEHKLVMHASHNLAKFASPTIFIHLFHPRKVLGTSHLVPLPIDRNPSNRS